MFALKRCFPYVGLGLAVVALSACRQPASPLEHSIADVMRGEWSYGAAGIQVAIAIDTTAGVSFGGRVTSWFTGDVGLAPAGFSRIQGSVDSSSNVAIEFRRTNSAATITIRGVVTGDVLTVRESWLNDAPGPFTAGNCFARVR